MLIVQKFGGSSVADRERLQRAAEICIKARRSGHEVVAVVSAMGDTTDELIELAHTIEPQPSSRELDALMGTGEQQSAALLAIMLESLGQPARSFCGWQAGIFTHGPHGDAQISMMIPGRIHRALSEGRVAVVSGFQGVSELGDISTLGRGGSDTTAVALAAAMGADRCEIYTDVDGIYTADPRLIPKARFIPQIDYRDMLALAKAGSQVLHSRSVELAMANGVEIQLLSTFKGEGGSVVKLLPESARPDFAGVTRSEDNGTVTIAGIAADAAVLSALVLLLAKEDIPVLSAEFSDGSLSLQVDPKQLLKALELVHSAYFL